MNKKYFKYLCISNKFVFLIAMFFGLMISILPDLGSKILFVTDTVVVISVLSSIYYLSYIHRKEEVSTYNAFPITKKELWKTRFIFSCTLVSCWMIIVLFIGLIPSYLYGDLKNEYLIKGIILVAVTVLMLILLNVVLQTICAFIIESCNNLFDSVISMIAYLALPIYTLNTLQYSLGMTTYTIGNLFNYVPRLVLSPIGFPKEFISKCTYFFLYGDQAIEVTQTLLLVITFIMWILIAIILYRLMLKRIQTHGTELANQKSTVWWITKVPVIWLTILFMMVLVAANVFENHILFIFVVVLYIVGLSIYQRKLVFTKNAFLVFVALFLGLSGFRFVFMKTEAFGLEEWLVLRRDFRNFYMQQKIDNSSSYETWQVTTSDEKLMMIIKNEVETTLNDYYATGNKNFAYSEDEVNLLQVGYAEDPSSYFNIYLSDERYQEIRELLVEKEYEKTIVVEPR
ncbi:MAG: hypothetical protein RR658_09270 [Anaerorhabdus sp.]|uniref:hypothetical protein n=1 Tax=Anaerorhabdus sp. TaxID=1872524 RepID=UPI002FCB69D4